MRRLVGFGLLAAAMTVPGLVRSSDSAGTIARTESLSLDAAVREALENAPALRAIDGRAAAATYEADGVARGRWGELDALASYDYLNDDQIVRPISRELLQQGFAGLPFDRSQLHYGLTYEIPLYLGGKLGARTDVARMRAEEAHELLEGTRWQLRFNVGSLYVSAGALDAVEHAIGERIAALEQTDGRLRLMVEHGKRPELDRLKVVEEMQEARAGLARVRAAGVRVRALLLAVVGRDPSSKVVLGPWSSRPPELLVGRDELRDAGRASSTVRRARLRVGQADGGVKIARGAYRPDLVGRANYFLHDAPSLEDPLDTWGVGVALRLPLYAGGGRGSRVAAARQTLLASEAELDRATLEAAADVEDALARFDASVAGSEVRAGSSVGGILDRGMATQRTGRDGGGRMKRGRWIWLLVVLVIVAGLALVRARRVREKVDAPTMADASIAVRVAPVTFGEVTEVRHVMGHVYAADESSVASRITAQVLTVPVRQGARVTTGALLAALDATDLEDAVAQADARLLAAREAVAAAKTAFVVRHDITARDKILYEAKAIARETYDLSLSAESAARAARETAIAGLDVADKALDVARTRLGYTRITAPFDGVVAERLVDPGDLALPGKTLIRVVRDGLSRVRAEVPQEDFPLLHVGQAVRVQFSAGTIDAAVSRVFPAMGQAHLATFEIDLDDPPAGLVSGATSGVDIVLRSIGGLLVPRDAVLESDAGAFVFVVTDGLVRVVPIDVTGRGRDELVVASADLSPGAHVVVARPSRLMTLSNGSRVEPSADEVTR